MANVAFPCKTKCYARLIQWASEKQQKLHVSYTEVRGDAAYELHQDLSRTCSGH